MTIVLIAGENILSMCTKVDLVTFYVGFYNCYATLTTGCLSFIKDKPIPVLFEVIT